MDSKQSSFIGRQLNRRYEILELIGSGSMGQVFKVRDKKRNTVRALKLVNILKNRVPFEALMRFKTEGDILRNLQHPSIIKYYDFFNEGDLYGLVMEYLPSPNLFQHLRKSGPFSLAKTLFLAKSLVEALVFIHDRKLVHLDLKPSNILLSFDTSGTMSIKVLDFGFSQIIGMSDNRTGGTLSYMAPEQTGILQKTIDHRADLYAVGIILYEVLVGRVPFREDDPAMVVYQHIAQEPEKPSTFRKDIPPLFESILIKLISKDPEDRYRTTAGLLKDIEKYERLSEKTPPESLSFQLGEDDHWDSFPRTNPFVGREKEKELLRTVADSVTDKPLQDGQGFMSAINKGKPLHSIFRPVEGRAGIVFLEGAKGTGKTELLKEFYNEFQIRPGITWFHEAIKEAYETPYKTTRTILSNLEFYLKRLHSSHQETVRNFLQKHFREEMSVIRELIPAMRFLDGNRSEDGRVNPSTGSAADYISVVFKLLQRMTRIERRLIVIIDNFQNVELSSVDLIFELISRISNLPILIVLSYNYEELSAEHRKGINRYINQPGSHHMVLSPLSEVEVARMMQLLFSYKLHDIPKILDPLYSATQGNPSQLRNILQKLIDRKLIYFQNQSWQAKTDEILEFIKTQRTVNATLTPLVDWPREEIEMLARGSIFLRSFSFDALKALCDVEPQLELSEKRLLETLDRAVSVHVLTVSSQKLYSFSDNNTRYALLSDLDPDLKSRLYRSVAEFLTLNILPDNPEAILDIARHQEHGGDFLKAMESYVVAAELTDNGMFTNRQSEIYYNKALLCLKELGDSFADAERQFDLRYRAVKHSLSVSNKYGILWDELNQMESWVREDKIRKIQLLELRIALSFRMGNKKEMLACGDELIQLGTDPEDEKYIVSSIILLGSVVSDKTFEQRLKLLRHGTEIAFKNRLFYHTIGPLTVYCILCAYLLRFDEAEAFIKWCSDALENTGLEEMKVLVPVWPTISLEIERGNFNRALEFAVKLEPYSEMAGPMEMALYQTSLAHIQGMLGNFAESLQLYEKLLPSVENAKQRVEALPVYFGRINVAIRMKEYETALSYVEKAFHIVKLRPDPYWECQVIIQAATANLELGQLDEASSLLKRAREKSAPLNAPLLNFHLEFAELKYKWKNTSDTDVIDQAKSLLDDMLEKGVTGFYELYRENLETWQKHPSRSSTSLSSFKSGESSIIKLFEINHKITTTLDLDEIFKAALEGAMQITGANHGYLFTCENMDSCSHEMFHDPRITRDAHGNRIPAEKYRFSTSLLKTAMEKREVIITRDARNESQWAASESIQDFNLRSVLVAPILFGEILKGFIYLDNHHATAVFSTKDREIVGVFATQVAIALNHAESYTRQQKISAENARLYREIKEHSRNLEHQVALRTRELNEKTNELQELNRNLELRVNKELQRRLEQEQLLIQQSKMAAMGEMIGMIAHQWRQPLSSISTVAGNMQIFLDLDMIDKTEFSTLLTTINEQVQFLSNTINDFRDFFSPKKRAEEVNLQEILGKTLKLIGKSLESKNIKLDNECTLLTPIHTYSNEMMQVFLNIIKNAQDVLMEKQVRNPKISILGRETGRYQVITISDNAGGIPEQYMDKIFEPYFSTKDEKTGTGLGLYMSKMIVEKHCGGELNAININDGASFEIKLPLKNPAIR